MIYFETDLKLKKKQDVLFIVPFDHFSRSVNTDKLIDMHLMILKMVWFFITNCYFFAIWHVVLLIKDINFDCDLCNMESHRSLYNCSNLEILFGHWNVVIRTFCRFYNYKNILENDLIDLYMGIIPIIVHALSWISINLNYCFNYLHFASTGLNIECKIQL